MDIYGKRRKRALPDPSTSNSVKTMNQDTPPAKKAKVNNEGQVIKRLIVKLGPDVIVSREVSVERDRKRKVMGEGTSASRNMPLIEAESKRMRTTAPCLHESNLQTESSKPWCIYDIIKTRKGRSTTDKDKSADFNEPEITLPKRKRKRKKKSRKNKLKDQIDKRPHSNESADLKNKKIDDCIQNNQSKQSVKEEKDNNCIDLKPLVPANLSCSYMPKVLNESVSSADDLDQKTESLVDSSNIHSKEDYHNLESVNLNFEFENNSNESKFGRGASSASNSKPPVEFDYQREMIQSIANTLQNSEVEYQSGDGVSSSYPNHQRPCENTGDYLSLVNEAIKSIMEKERYIEPAAHQEYCSNVSNLIPALRTYANFNDLASQCTKIFLEDTNKISKPYMAGVSPMTDSTAEKDPIKSDLNVFSEVTVKTAEMQFKESMELDSNASFASSENLKCPIEENESPKLLDPFKELTNTFYGYEEIVESDNSLYSPESETRSAKEIVKSDGGLVSPKPEMPSARENTLLKVKPRSATEIVESDGGLVSPKPEKPTVSENTLLKVKTRSATEIVESKGGLVSPKPEKPTVSENTLLKIKTRSATEIVESDGGLVSPKPEKPTVSENTLLKVKTRSATEIVESDGGLVSPKPKKPTVSENTLLKEKTRSEKFSPVLHMEKKNGAIIQVPIKFISQNISNALISNTLMPFRTLSIPTATTTKKMLVINQNSVATRTTNSKDIPTASNASKEGEPKSQSENSRKILLNYKKTPLVLGLPAMKVLSTPLNEKHFNGISLPSFTEQNSSINSLRIFKTKHLPSPLLKESAQSMSDQENSKKETSGLGVPDIKAKLLNDKHVYGTISPSCSNHSRPFLTTLEVANDKGLRNPKLLSLSNKNVNVVRVQNETKSKGSKLSSFIPNGNIPGFSTHLNTEIRRIPERGYVIPKKKTESQNPVKMAIPGSRLQSLSKEGPLKLSSVEPRNNNRHENILRASDLKKHNSPSMDHKHKNSASSKDDPKLDRVKIVYAGNVPPGYDENCLRRRFGVFGEIERIEIKKSKDKEYDSSDMDLHTFGEKKRFAFITFKTREAATQARENGNKCGEPILKLDYGLRRQYVKEDYTDLDGKVAENEGILYNSHAPSITHLRKEDDDYSLLLAKEQMKRGLLSK